MSLRGLRFANFFEQRVEIFAFKLAGADKMLGEGARAELFVSNIGRDYTRVEVEVTLAKGAHFEFGGVTIGDDVEIGACCTIDRATLAQTRIGRGTKIDNLVMIAHNVTIGEDCVIVSQVGISGSTHVGNHVTIAGQVGIVGHVEIGDNAILMAQSGVSKDIPDVATYLGSPARDVGQQKRIIAVEGSLPDHVKTIRQLVRRVEELERRLGRDSGVK